VDLSQLAGQQVEVSIVFATDWGTLRHEDRVRALQRHLKT
jgi:hypothetical protein